ncbi:MAG: hypothetical protein K9H65_04240 [Bacteroidales bacterium]|nr:hypothetical protein [Bacteroidales bacterium]
MNAAYIAKIKLFLILFIIPAYLFSQNTNKTFRDTTKQTNDSSETAEEKSGEKTIQQRTDTLQLFGDETRYVNVMKITYNSVIYTETGKTTLKRIDKDSVHKILYNWGRVETLNESPPIIGERYDWRKVKILNNKNETDSLYRVEKIQARAEGSNRGYDTPKSLETRAKIIIKKKAANVNAKYVLITNKTVTIAFGEIPSATLEGIAYTDEKREKQHNSQQQ